MKSGLGFLRRRTAFAAITATLLLLYCGGGGVNTGNAKGSTITGRIVEWNGADPSHCTVFLYNASSTPPLPPLPDTTRLRAASTDNTGAFKFVNVFPGTYNIVGQDSLQKTATLIPLITIPAEGDTVADIGNDTLTRVTSFSGVVRKLPPGYAAVCHVPGSPFIALSNTSRDTSATFIIDNLPSRKPVTLIISAIPPSPLGKTCATSYSPGRNGYPAGLPDTLTIQQFLMPCPLP
jgi:hypothetical protein